MQWLLHAGWSEAAVVADLAAVSVRRWPLLSVPLTLLTFYGGHGPLCLSFLVGRQEGMVCVAAHAGGGRPLIPNVQLAAEQRPRVAIGPRPRDRHILPNLAAARVCQLRQDHILAGSGHLLHRDRRWHRQADPHAHTV